MLTAEFGIIQWESRSKIESCRYVVKKYSRDESIDDSKYRITWALVSMMCGE